MRPTLLFLLAASAPLSAQSPIAVSESYAASARTTSSGGAHVQSASFAGQAMVAISGASQTLASESYRAAVGHLALPAALSPSVGPVPVHLAVDAGSSAGGQTNTLWGLHLDPGFGGATVQFGNGPHVQAHKTSAQSFEFVQPAGINAYGNPLGSTAVEFKNELGSGQTPDLYRYLPALVHAHEVSLGSTLELTVHTEAGGTFFLATGLPSPPLAVPLAGVDGALELLVQLVLLEEFVTLAPGENVLSYPIPTNPALASADLWLQGVVLTSLFGGFAGSHTNATLVDLVQ